MHRFVALKEQGNYSFVGRCKVGNVNAIAKFTRETSFGIEHEFEVLNRLQHYPWFPKPIKYYHNLKSFSHSSYKYKGDKEMFIMEDVGGAHANSMYTFMNFYQPTKHVMDAIAIQTTGAICAMHSQNIVHNDMHANNIIIRPCKHAFVVYINKQNNAIIACTPTYGIEPIIIDMGMAKNVQSDGLCFVGEYHTQLGMSMSGTAIDGRFDAATFLLNIVPMYEQYGIKCDHLQMFIQCMRYNKQSARPCDRWFSSLYNAILNTIPNKLLTKHNHCILVDAAFMARSLVPIRKYKPSDIGLHEVWREMYGIMFKSGQVDPLKPIKDICVKLRKSCGKTWNRQSWVVKSMGKFMASLTVRINARNNKDKKRLYAQTHWQSPHELLVMLSMMKTMQSKTSNALQSASSSSKVLVYEQDTDKTYLASIKKWKHAIADYVSRCVAKQETLQDTAAMVAVMTPSPLASKLAMRIVETQQLYERHALRLKKYKYMVAICMYVLLGLAKCWTVALKLMIQD